MSMHLLKTPASRLMLAAIVFASSYDVASAQTRPAPEPGAEAPIPVEILAETINSNLQCRPPRARLPARNRLELRVVNRAERPVAFAAPKFFNASKVIESGGFTWDIVNDTFVVAPRSTVWVRLQTPVPGEYYYSCFDPGQVPRADTSGFLIVTSAAE